MAMWKAIVSQNAREEAARVECGATLTHALLVELTRYHWPGNVRELQNAIAAFERRCVEVALARASGNRTHAAAELGLSRQGLLKTMARLGLDAPPET